MTRAALALTLSLAACTGPDPLTETGNPNLEGEVAMVARSADPAVAVGSGGTAARTAPGLRITEATIAVERLKFVMGDVCDRPGETEWVVRTPPTLDLVGAVDALPFDARTGDYCRVDLRLRGEETTLAIAGTRADGVPFEVVSDGDFRLDVRSRGAPFALSEAADHFLLAFDAASWLDPVAIDAAPAAGGRVTISPDENEDLLADVEAALAASLDLFEDADDDGALSDDEAESALATSAP